MTKLFSPPLAWDTLAANALEPAAGGLAGWATALKAWGEPLLIRKDDMLAGVFSVQKKGRFLRSLKTPLSFSGLPLVSRSHADLAIAGLLNQPGIDAVLLRGIPASGPFWDRLHDQSVHIKTLDSWERAALFCGTGTFEEWFATSLENKRRKEYRRLRARLSEAGNLVSESWSAAEPLEPWIDAFLALEAAGWKGARGTALAMDLKAVSGLREGLPLMAAGGHLRFWRMRLDGQPIAMMFALVHGNHAWLGKIAHAEAFARFSPGVLLILDATEALFADPAIAVADSCAIPGHPMIDHIWRDRLVIADVLVAATKTSHSRFGLILAWVRARAALRAHARNAFYRLTRRKIS